MAKGGFVTVLACEDRAAVQSSRRAVEQPAGCKRSAMCCMSAGRLTGLMQVIGRSAQMGVGKRLQDAKGPKQGKTSFRPAGVIRSCFAFNALLLEAC